MTVKRGAKRGFSTRKSEKMGRNCKLFHVEHIVTMTSLLQLRGDGQVQENKATAKNTPSPPNYAAAFSS
jgi:hypothetical protein